MVGGADDAVQLGIRTFPVHKLTIIGSEAYQAQAEQMAVDIRRVLGISAEVVALKKPSVRRMLETVGGILEKEKENFEDFIINVGGGDKHFTCAATTAAFVYGIKAFDVMGDELEMLPVMKLSYYEVVSK